MAVGVRAFSAYVPWTRLAVGNARMRSLASSDEDALTLAVEAAVPLAERHRAAKGAFSGVLFAATSAPFKETSCASLLAGACDVPLERLRTTDLAGSPRAGVQAMLAALERLQADRESADALVAAAHAQSPQPASAGAVRLAGDAAAALVLGRTALVAELLGTHSVAAEVDILQVDSDPAAVEPSAAFVPTTRAAIAGALTNANIQIAEVAHFAIGAPSTAAANALMKAAGADSVRLAPLFDDVIGHAGAAQALLSFAAALESSKAGDILVLAAWGDGADALVFRTIDGRPRSARPLAAMFERSRVLPDDGTYPGLRRAAANAPATGPAPGLRLRGAKCRHCDLIRFPILVACSACAKEDSDPVRLSRRGTFAGPGLVDLDGGGRIAIPIADADAALQPGVPVELTLRYSPESGHIWKARPVRA